MLDPSCSFLMIDRTTPGTAPRTAPCAFERGMLFAASYEKNCRHWIALLLSDISLGLSLESKSNLVTRGGAQTCTVAMAQRNFTPVNQIRLTNVAIVKYKKGTAYSPWLEGKRSTAPSTGLTLACVAERPRFV